MEELRRMFEKIIGHEQNKKHFANRNSYSQAYIFEGIEGIGKFMFAMEIAKSLSGLDRNIHVVKPDKTSISVDQIREVQVDIAMPPFNGLDNKRVVIIDDADKMNETAQNALLKTLEEPPAYVIMFLVVSDVDKLLTTVKSRGKIFKFFRLSDKQIKELLSDLKIESKLERFVLSYVKGSVGKARELVEAFEKLDEIKDCFSLLSRLEKFTMTKDNKLFVEFVDYFKGDRSRLSYLSGSVDYFMKLYYDTDKEIYLKYSNLIDDALSDIYRGASLNTRLLPMLVKISELNS